MAFPAGFRTASPVAALPHLRIAVCLERQSRNPQTQEIQLATRRQKMDWKNRKVLVTGGASFIGSTLVDALVSKGASVRVVDNFSSGKREHLARALEEGSIELVEGDLLDGDTAREAVRGMDVVFHLAADHGGRGYVDLHQAACASNLALDALVFRACAQEKVS